MKNKKNLKNINIFLFIIILIPAILIFELSLGAFEEYFAISIGEKILAVILGLCLLVVNVAIGVILLYRLVKHNNIKDKKNKLLVISTLSTLFLLVISYFYHFIYINMPRFLMDINFDVIFHNIIVTLINIILLINITLIYNLKNDYLLKNIINIILNIVSIFCMAENIEYYFSVSNTIIYWILLIIFEFIVDVSKLVKKKKISNIICGLSATLVCIIALWNFTSNKITENNNKQILQYIEHHSVELNPYSFDSVENVKGLINSTIKNNKSGKKVTLIYQNTSYVSVDELNQLLTKLDTNQSYYAEIKYYSENYNSYIDSITIALYGNKTLEESIRRYGHESSRGSIVKELLSELSNFCKDYTDMQYNANIIYTSEADKMIINVSNGNLQEIDDLRKKVHSGKLYKVEIQNDTGTNVCNIIITENN